MGRKPSYLTWKCHLRSLTSPLKIILDIHPSFVHLNYDKGLAARIESMPHPPSCSPPPSVRPSLEPSPLHTMHLPFLSRFLPLYMAWSSFFLRQLQPTPCPSNGSLWVVWSLSLSPSHLLQVAQDSPSSPFSFIIILSFSSFPSFLFLFALSVIGSL